MLWTPLQAVQIRGGGKKVRLGNDVGNPVLLQIKDPEQKKHPSCFFETLPMRFEAVQRTEQSRIAGTTSKTS